jgi:hypothetical protein
VPGCVAFNYPGRGPVRMSVGITAPTERTCEVCGRREAWDDDADAWRVVRDDGTRLAGNVYCIHEWDINGTFAPVERADS